jgi:hypothetical protein
LVFLATLTGTTDLDMEAHLKSMRLKRPYKIKLESVNFTFGAKHMVVA